MWCTGSVKRCTRPGGVLLIWATRVPESMVRQGTLVRGEMTDAAMAPRAGSAKLNKGPWLMEAIPDLNGPGTHGR